MIQSGSVGPGSILNNPWWGRPRPSLPQSNALPLVNRDRTTLSERRPTSRAGILEQARNRVGEFFGGVGDNIESAGGSASKGIQGFFDFLGQGASQVESLKGDIVGGAVSLGSGAAADVLDWAGQESGADRVRAAGKAASQFINETADQSGEINSGFLSGVGDGVANVVEDLSRAAANPVQTARALERLNQAVNPIAQVSAIAQGKDPREMLRENWETGKTIVDGVRSEYEQTGRDHGTAGQIGRAAFDIASTFFSGGSSAPARVTTKAAAGTLDDVARASSKLSGPAQNAAQNAIKGAGETGLFEVTKDEVNKP